MYHHFNQLHGVFVEMKKSKFMIEKLFEDLLGKYYLSSIFF